VARNGAHLRDRRYLPSFQASACASRVPIKVFAAPTTPSFRVKITHFIDDRTDVLEPMAGIVPNCYLFGPQRGRIAAGMRHVMTWRDAMQAIVP
jgi:hypothetical protein